MSIIFEKGELPSDFRKTLIKSLYKKDDKSECGNYRGNFFFIFLFFVVLSVYSVSVYFVLYDGLEIK